MRALALAVAALALVAAAAATDAAVRVDAQMTAVSCIAWRRHAAARPGASLAWRARAQEEMVAAGLSHAAELLQTPRVDLCSTVRRTAPRRASPRVSAHARPRRPRRLSGKP
jgi:hypothetical protein